MVALKRLAAINLIAQCLGSGLIQAAGLGIHYHLIVIAGLSDADITVGYVPDYHFRISQRGITVATAAGTVKRYRVSGFGKR